MRCHCSVTLYICVLVWLAYHFLWLAGYLNNTFLSGYRFVYPFEHMFSISINSWSPLKWWNQFAFHQCWRRVSTGPYSPMYLVLSALYIWVVLISMQLYPTVTCICNSITYPVIPRSLKILPCILHSLFGEITLLVFWSF